MLHHTSPLSSPELLPATWHLVPDTDVYTWYLVLYTSISQRSEGVTCAGAFTAVPGTWYLTWYVIKEPAKQHRATGINSSSKILEDT